jgi:hypothetical protein
MKVVALILSIIVFSQSLSVCGPTFGQRPHKEEAKNCKMDDADQTAAKKVSCCSKKTERKHDHQEKDDCCGDNCKCFTCSKVLLNTTYRVEIEGIHNSIKTENTIEPVLVKSFDFHPSIAYPPIF